MKVDKVYFGRKKSAIRTKDRMKTNQTKNQNAFLRSRVSSQKVLSSLVFSTNDVEIKIVGFFLSFPNDNLVDVFH